MNDDGKVVKWRCIEDSCSAVVSTLPTWVVTSWKHPWIANKVCFAYVPLYL
jgi:hypothetical protein